VYPNIIPVNFGVKFSPPKLGLSYFVVGQTDQVTLKYEIHMDEYLTMDAETVTATLFEIHKDFLNPKYIKRNQVKKLVEKVLSVCGKKQVGKENSDVRNKKIADPVLSKYEQSVAAPLTKKTDGTLQLEPLSKALPAYKEPKKQMMLDQAPDSERSLPSGIGSDFNDL
jgi:hypothetical protein